MEENTIIDQLKLQMKMVIEDKITMEQYAQVAESHCSEYGHLIANTQFYKTFMEIIPDLCLFYLTEPGDADIKKIEFRKGMKEAYNKLKLL